MSQPDSTSNFSFLTQEVPNRPEWRAAVDESIDFALRNGFPSRYDYMAVFASGSAGSPVTILFSRTPTIGDGSVVIRHYRGQNSASVTVNHFGISSNAQGGIAFWFADLSAGLHLGYFVQDRSTAAPNNIHELSSQIVIVGSSEIDKSVLTALLAEAKEIEQSNYTYDSWVALQNAITNGQAVVNNANATQAQVDAAYNALLIALNALEEEQHTITKFALGAADGTTQYIGQINETDLTITFEVPDSSLTASGRLERHITELETPNNMPLSFYIQGFGLFESFGSIGTFVGFSSGDYVFLNDSKRYRLELKPQASAADQIRAVTIGGIQGEIDQAQRTITFPNVPSASILADGRFAGTINSLDADSEAIYFHVFDDDHGPFTPGQLVGFRPNGVDTVFTPDGRPYSLYFEVDQPSTGETVFDYNHADISFFRPWNHNANAQISGERISSGAGASATLEFVGTSVAIVGVKNTNRGIMQVYINGNLADEIDLYAPRVMADQELFRIDNLPSGSNTIQIVRSDERNPSSTGAGFIGLQAFIVS